jgi:hypothetical protein
MFINGVIGLLELLPGLHQVIQLNVDDLPCLCQPLLQCDRHLVGVTTTMHDDTGRPGSGRSATLRALEIQM